MHAHWAESVQSKKLAIAIWQPWEAAYFVGLWPRLFIVSMILIMNKMISNSYWALNNGNLLAIWKIKSWLMISFWRPTFVRKYLVRVHRGFTGQVGGLQVRGTARILISYVRDGLLGTSSCSRKSYRVKIMKCRRCISKMTTSVNFTPCLIVHTS